MAHTHTLFAKWERPECRDFAAVIDHHVLAEVLGIATSAHTISSHRLMSEDEGLSSRLRKLIKIRHTTQTSATGLVTLSTRFGWLRKLQGSDSYQITDDGRRAHALSRENPDKFRIQVLEALHKFYLIPGWFVDRLFKLNPRGQGAVVLPSPRRGYTPEKQKQTDCEWTTELRIETGRSIDAINRHFPGACPIDDSVWADAVEQEWKALSSERNQDGSLRKRRSKKKASHSPEFGVRGRLLHAMREASLKLLFGKCWGSELQDFETAPLSYRASQVWFPRLADLELIFYTDYHSDPSADISGRIVVPCASYRSPPLIASKEKEANFLPVGIRNPEGVCLSLHQPVWEGFRSLFSGELVSVYQKQSVATRVRYVSLLAVRDKICRHLRISANRFDLFLECLYSENAAGPMPELRIDSISIESDLRLDQRSAVGLNQRPVYINRIPQSLIAIKVL